MADRPIIFSAPMVRALLDGRKTQTRRVLKRPTDHFHASYMQAELSGLPGHVRWWDGSQSHAGRSVRLPYAPGDRLYVREACKPIPESKPGGYFVPGSPFYGVDWFYRADGNCPLWADGPWRPSIHMPRSASRITLTVTDVRVQRLQEIEWSDAAAEGVDVYSEKFSDLWNSLHGPEAWAANPWVVAVSFTVAKGNIDAPATPTGER